MKRLLLDQNSGGTGTILRKFTLLFFLFAILIGIVLISVYGIRNLYFLWAGSSKVVLSGQVFQVTDRGNLALQDATVSIMHEGERIMDTTDNLGKFHLEYTCRKRGKGKERVVVNYPQFETVGREIALNYTEGTYIDSMVFRLGNLSSNANEMVVMKVRDSIRQAHQEFLLQYEMLSSIADSLRQQDTTREKYYMIERLLNQHQYNTRYLMEDSLLFAFNEISVDRMKQRLTELQNKQRKILEVKDSLIRNP